MAERPLLPGTTDLPAPYRDRSGWPDGNWRPLASNTVWNTALPEQPPIHERSSEIVTNLLAQTAHQGISPPGIGPIYIVPNNPAEDWQIPVYWANSNDPLYTLHSTEPWGYPWDHEGTTIRCPVDAQPAGGGDAHMDVIQPDGTVWSFWQAVKDDQANTITCSWGGPHALYGDGISVNGNTAVAIGNLPMAGSMRAAELAAGSIDHALALVVGCCGNDTMYPADGNSFGTTCDMAGWTGDSTLADKPIMGMRFRLRYTEQELADLPVPEWKRTILRAMSQHGMIVTDTGGVTHVRWESDQSFTSFGYDPAMHDYLATQDGVWVDPGVELSADLNDDVDWSRLEVMAEGYWDPVPPTLVDRGAEVITRSEVQVRGNLQVSGWPGTWWAEYRQPGEAYVNAVQGGSTDSLSMQSIEVSLPGLTGGTEYEYRLVAVSDAGQATTDWTRVRTVLPTESFGQSNVEVPHLFSPLRVSSIGRLDPVTGEGPPTNQGNEGDYYYDRKNRKLWGPKPAHGWTVAAFPTRSQLIERAQALGVAELRAPGSITDPMENLGTLDLPDASLGGDASLTPGLVPGGAAVDCGASGYVESGWEGRTNLATDPDFENGLSRWTDITGAGYTAGWASSDAWAYSGTKSVRFQATKDDSSTGRTFGLRADPFAVSPGEVWTMSYRVNINDPPSSHGIRVNVNWYDGADSYISTSSGQYTNEVGEHWIVNTVTAPTGAVSGRGFIVGFTNEALDTIDVFADAVLIERAGDRGTFFPTPDQLTSGLASFSGTPHASASDIGPFPRGAERVLVEYVRRNTEASDDVILASSDGQAMLQIDAGGKDVSLTLDGGANWTTWTDAYPGGLYETVPVVLRLDGAGNAKLTFRSLATGEVTHTSSKPVTHEQVGGTLLRGGIA